MFGKKKVDGVVEAVHFGADGLAEWFRIFERRGPTWSDRVKLSRADLIARIQDGKKFAVGKRIPLQATDFEMGDPVTIIEKNGKIHLACGQHNGSSDTLANVPVV